MLESARGGRIKGEREGLESLMKNWLAREEERRCTDAQKATRGVVNCGKTERARANANGSAVEKK